jgi:hypothetical protein
MNLLDTLNGLVAQTTGVLGALNPPPRPTTVTSPAPAPKSTLPTWAVPAMIGTAILALVLILVSFSRGR